MDKKTPGDAHGGIHEAEAAVLREADRWERLRSAGPDKESEFRTQVFTLGAVVVALRDVRGVAEVRAARARPKRPIVDKHKGDYAGHPPPRYDNDPEPAIRPGPSGSRGKASVHDMVGEFILRAEMLDGLFPRDWCYFPIKVDAASESLVYDEPTYVLDSETDYWKEAVIGHSYRATLPTRTISSVCSRNVFFRALGDLPVTADKVHQVIIGVNRPTATWGMALWVKK